MEKDISFSCEYITMVKQMVMSRYRKIHEYFAGDTVVYYICCCCYSCSPSVFFFIRWSVVVVVCALDTLESILLYVAVDDGEYLVCMYVLLCSASCLFAIFSIVLRLSFFGLFSPKIIHVENGKTVDSIRHMHEPPPITFGHHFATHMQSERNGDEGKTDTKRENRET